MLWVSSNGERTTQIFLILKRDSWICSNTDRPKSQHCSGLTRKTLLAIEYWVLSVTWVIEYWVTVGSHSSI